MKFIKYWIMLSTMSCTLFTQANIAHRGAAAVKTVIGATLTGVSAAMTVSTLTASTGLAVYYTASSRLKNQLFDAFFSDCPHDKKATIQDFLKNASLPLSLVTGGISLLAAYCTYRLLVYTSEKADEITK